MYALIMYILYGMAIQKIPNAENLLSQHWIGVDGARSSPSIFLEHIENKARSILRNFPWIMS